MLIDSPWITVLEVLKEGTTLYLLEVLKLVHNGNKINDTGSFLKAIYTEESLL